MTNKDKKFFEEACNNKAAIVINLIYKMLDTNKDKALTYLALHKLQYEIIQALEVIKDDIDIDEFLNGDQQDEGNE